MLQYVNVYVQYLYLCYLCMITLTLTPLHFCQDIHAFHPSHFQNRLYFCGDAHEANEDIIFFIYSKAMTCHPNIKANSNINGWGNNGGGCLCNMSKSEATSWLSPVLYLSMYSFKKVSSWFYHLHCHRFITKIVFWEFVSLFDHVEEIKLAKVSLKNTITTLIVAKELHNWYIQFPLQWGIFLLTVWNGGNGP